MSEPEISRRCPSCGASIRSQAFFCPQCGKELIRKSEAAKPSRPTVTASLVDASPGRDTADLEAPAAQPGKEATAPKSKEPAGPPQQASARRAAGEPRGKIQRATTLARDVEGDVIHRVQKLREISTVVIDEAGYDPSLRFVLIAAVLFVMFLVIVLLNKLIS